MSEPTLTGKRRFTRQNAQKKERQSVYWQHVDDSYDVVSTFLHTEWRNATHPENHDGFSFDESLASTGCWRPDDPSQWLFKGATKETMTATFDNKGFRRFRLTLQNSPDEKYVNGENPSQEGPDIRNAQEVAEWLSTPFTARYTKDGMFAGTGRYVECSHCHGTGVVCEADHCLSYCTSESCGADRISDPSCTCTQCSTTHGDHETECPKCDGEGETHEQYFYRKFSAFLTPDSAAVEQIVSADTMNTLISRLASKTDESVNSIRSTLQRSGVQSADEISSLADLPDDLQGDLAIPDEGIMRVIQAGFNASITRNGGDPPSDTVVRTLFHLVESERYDELINYTNELMRPLYDTVERPVTLDEDDSRTVEVVDMDAYQAGAEHLRTHLPDFVDSGAVTATATRTTSSSRIQG